MNQTSNLVNVLKAVGLDDFIQQNQENLQQLETMLHQEISDTEEIVNSHKHGEENEINIFQEIQIRTQDLKAFIQTFVYPMSANARAIVFLIVGEKANIEKINIEYIKKRSFFLTVELSFRTGERITLSCDDLWDIELIRHLGYMKIGGRPVIDGYYSIG